MTDAETLKAWRTARGLSQAQAGTFLGVSRRQVIKVETGLAKISPDVRERMDSRLAQNATVKPPRKEKVKAAAPNLPPPIKPGERVRLPYIAPIEKTMPDGSVFTVAAPPLGRPGADRLEVLIDAPPDDKTPIYMGQLHAKLPAPRDLGPAIRATYRNTAITPPDRLAAVSVIKLAELERLSMIEVHPDGFRVPSNLLGLTVHGKPCVSREIHDPPVIYPQGGIVRESRVYRARNGEGPHSVVLVGTPAKIPMPSEPGFYPVPAGAYSPVNYAAGANAPHAAQKAGEAKRRQSDSART